MLNKAERFKILKFIGNCCNIGYLPAVVNLSSWHLQHSTTGRRKWPSLTFFGISVLHCLYKIAMLIGVYFTQKQTPLHELIIHAMVALGPPFVFFWYYLLFIKYPGAFSCFFHLTLTGNIGGNSFVFMANWSALQLLGDITRNQDNLISRKNRREQNKNKIRQPPQGLHIARLGRTHIAIHNGHCSSRNMGNIHLLPNDTTPPVCRTTCSIPNMAVLHRPPVWRVPIYPYPLFRGNSSLDPSSHLLRSREPSPQNLDGLNQTVTFVLFIYKFETNISTLSHRTGNRRTLQRTYGSLRHIQLYISVINDVNRYIIFSTKVMLLCVSIGAGYAAIAHFSDYPIFGVMYYIIVIQASFLYTVSYDKAFKIPGSFKEATKQALLRLCGGNHGDMHILKRQMLSIPPVGIKVGEFHVLERQSTPAFVDYVVNNIVSMLVAFRH